MGKLKECGGKKKKQKKDINCIQGFVQTNSHTKFVLMDVPHRYDLEHISCVNKEVDKYNRRLQNHMKVFGNTEVIKANLDRRGFKKHRQRMNGEKRGGGGKGKKIAVAIKQALKV
jgi:hypothetical protein